MPELWLFHTAFLTMLLCMHVKLNIAALLLEITAKKSLKTFKVTKGNDSKYTEIRVMFFVHCAFPIMFCLHVKLYINSF